MNTIRDRLKEVIDSSGYSLRSFAREAGITPGGLSGIINGRTNVISGMFLKILEYRFNINPLWLQTGEGKMFVSKFNLSDDREIDLVVKFRNLDKNMQNSLLVMADALYLQHSQEAELVAEKNRKKNRNWQ